MLFSFTATVCFIVFIYCKLGNFWKLEFWYKRLRIKQQYFNFKLPPQFIINNISLWPYDKLHAFSQIKFNQFLMKLLQCESWKLHPLTPWLIYKFSKPTWYDNIRKSIWDTTWEWHEHSTHLVTIVLIHYQCTNFQIFYKISLSKDN